MMFEPQQRRNNPAARNSMALFRLSQAIKKITQAESDAAGLSPVQIQALLFARYTRDDMATVGNLAAAIGATHVTAVKIVNGLVKKGLLAKIQNPEDRRVTLLTLTAKGREAASRLQDWGRGLEEAVERIPNEILANLESGLGAVISILREKNYLVVSEPCLGCVHFRPNVGDTSTPHYCELIRKYLSHQAAQKECPEHTPASHQKAP